MRHILSSLIALTCITVLPAPALSDFTQADRERMIQIITKVEEIDKRFEQIDKRFGELREDMNARFVQVDKRFEQIDKRFEQVNNQFTTTTNLMMAMIGAFVAIVVMSIGFAYWDRRTMLRPMEEEVVRIKRTVSDKVERRIEDISTKVATLEKQVAQTAEAETGRRRRLQDALAEMAGRGGEDARLATFFRGLL